MRIFKFYIILSILSISMANDNVEKSETAVFGAGCFWCVEAVFQRLDGVQSVVPGYAGGKTENPTYESVCAGSTGHAEVAKITFDPNVITYPQLLEMFWKSHDPTTLNRQGKDVGTQYRSVIYYLDDEQKNSAEKSKSAVEESNLLAAPIVTEIEQLTKFYPAEDYHHNYYKLNPNQAYCRLIIEPKLKKLFDK